MSDFFFFSLRHNIKIKNVENSFLAAHRSPGEASGNNFCMGTHVWSNSQCLLGTTWSYSEATDYLVENKHDAIFFCEFSKLLDEFRLNRHKAKVRTCWFQKNGCNIVPAG